jgi:hypothetical protein
MKFSQASSDPQKVKNTEYWFGHELRQYPTTEFDWEKLKTYKDKLILACGDSNKGGFIYKPNTELSKLTGASIFEVPGGHIGYVTSALDFSDKLTQKMKDEQVL